MSKFLHTDNAKAAAIAQVFSKNSQAKNWNWSSPSKKYFLDSKSGYSSNLHLRQEVTFSLFLSFLLGKKRTYNILRLQLLSLCSSGCV